ncbi:hypothetical protein ACLOJK_029458 [Asimina triloba]
MMGNLLDVAGDVWVLVVEMRLRTLLLLEKASRSVLDGSLMRPATAALIATVLPDNRMVNGLIGDGFCGLDRSGSCGDERWLPSPRSGRMPSDLATIGLRKGTALLISGGPWLDMD